MGSGTKIPNLKALDSPIRRGQKMMRYVGLGNTLAEACGKGRLQYRHFSFASEKVGNAGTKIAAKYFFQSVFCGVGFVIGGLTSSPVGKQVQETEEIAIERLQHLDEREARLKALLEKEDY
ncbi:unnamed protein product [Microthlaspi erraticum]|uniref:Uncharacterized protein n=1 Tax=Microthlaspi erraticum TaxID=1685480 RepID=A0A6D2HTQ0_9BRAS|nr:unnamed protein product [Microthlaspi erraticum]